jgi:phage gp29-like protein
MHSFPASPAHACTHAHARTRTHTHAHTHTHTLQALTPEKEAELLEAATKGDMMKAQTLLKAGVSIDCRDRVCVYFCFCCFVWGGGWVNGFVDIV